ncbi:DUF3304 domain-containing protein [Stenotrophomonas sp. MMGLT7]|uniref:DUF3304 domain-containing protein n=1 Tax=Stenotrophomonas sp. MMGLT7 TaxID=2901227 RepID=UPI001E590383|nr:DUF3304 domain-containing protein [Stenotrophomonas sp. MMGLT7]MCD7099299.1 DUF3304 domain-containing protein [Stenotrophomonas sp. MMGLT7]
MTSTGTLPADGTWHLTRAEVQRPARWRWEIALLVMLLPMLASCRGKEESIPVGIVGYNHTDSNIYQFLINGGGGGSVHSHSGGGTTVCCAMVPAHWHQEMKVEIDWTTDLKTFRKRVVNVPRYTQVGDLAVHFLRDGEIKVFLTNVRLGHPEYPLTGPEAGLRAGEDPIRDEWRTDGKGARK